MTEEHIIVLYSKFSLACTKFMEMVNKIPTFQHTLICIDHPDIRLRLKNSKKLSIREVPSIIRLHQQTGYAETFEGERAFALLNARYIEYLQQTQLSQQEIQPQTKVSSVNAQSQSPIQSQPIAVQSQPVSVQTQPIPQKEDKKSSLTSLSELMDLGEIGGVEEINSRDDGIQSFHSVVPQNQMPPTTGIVKKDSSSGGNIVSRAMQMQKERDNETTSGPKPPMMRD